MESDQLKLLLQLAKSLKAKEKDKNRASAVASLHSANILTEKGDFTRHYPHLRKAVELAE